MSFRELGLRKITATRLQTLVQHPGQTIGPATIKIGMHLPKDSPYGHFFKKNYKFNFFSQKIEFVNWELEKLRLPGA